MSNKDDKKFRKMYRTQIDNVSHIAFGRQSIDIIKEALKQRNIMIGVSAVLLVSLILTNLLR
jgi:hypothetical protein